MWLILCNTVQLVIPNVCTKFQNPKSSSFREIFDRKKLTNTHAHTQIEKAKTIYPLYTSYAGGIINVKLNMKENPNRNRNGNRNILKRNIEYNKLMYVQIMRAQASLQGLHIF